MLTYPPFQELERPLVLGDLEQLHSTLFIRSMTGDLTDKIPNEFAVFGQALEGNNRFFVRKNFFHVDAMHTLNLEVRIANFETRDSRKINERQSPIFYYKFL